MKSVTPQQAIKAMDAVNTLRAYFDSVELDNSTMRYLSLQLHALHSLVYETSEDTQSTDLRVQRSS